MLYHLHLSAGSGFLDVYPISHGGGGHDGPQNVFDHCAQTRGRRKLELGDF